MILQTAVDIKVRDHGAIKSPGVPNFLKLDAFNCIPLRNGRGGAEPNNAIFPTGCHLFRITGIMALTHIGREHAEGMQLDHCMETHLKYTALNQFSSSSAPHTRNVYKQGDGPKSWKFSYLIFTQLTCNEVARGLRKLNGSLFNG